MPSPQRKPKPFRSDGSPEALDRLAWWQLVNLAESGAVSWSDVHASVARRVAERNGGVDPYAHLHHRQEWHA